MNLFDIKFKNDMPTDTVSESIEWMFNNCRDARWDIVARAIDILKNGKLKIADEHIQDKV